MRGEERTGPTQEATRTSSKDDIGGYIAVREDSTDENNAGHPSSSGSDNRRRITTKREPREARGEQSSSTEKHVPRRISVKTTPSEHAVVATQEALDGYREKTMRIASVENNTLNWVSISSAGAPDMTHCNFSARSARDEMSPMSSLALTKMRTGAHTWNSCELYEAQVARGQYFVHELMSEVNSRMHSVTRVMAMPGARTIVADLCMFGLAACDKGGPGFVNASVRTITNARQVGMRMQRKCAGAHWHARVDANNTIENMEQTGTWVHQVSRAMEEQLREDHQELRTREQKKKAKDAMRIRGIVHENDQKQRNKSRARRNGKPMHHDEQELLSLWGGWHWDDNTGGRLDSE